MNRYINNRMHKKDKYNLFNLNQLDAMALEIPYDGHRLTMMFILPNQKNGLKKLEEEFENVDLSLIARTKMTRFEKEVSIAIPKFKVESSLNLKDSLQRIGLKHMFDVKQADFSGMTDTKELFVSEVIQKAFIEVTEEGTEASAATATNFQQKSSFNNKNTPEFICDHPFVFMLKDNLTRMILFTGKITNPSL